MHSCIDEADDIALLLIANGIDAAELANFVKISAILAKGGYNKDVNIVTQRKWTKTMDEGSQLKIPRSQFQIAYDTRTTIHKSVVNALAAFLHLGKSSQMYVSTLKFQEDRCEIPDKFIETFSSYDKVGPSDTVTSQEQLVKSVKSGCDFYKSVGGVTCLVDLPLDGDRAVKAVSIAASAHQKDKVPLISKVSDPFHFVCNKIDVVKRQSLEHMAMRRVVTLCPNTLFYCVDDKMSVLDLENHQLTALPLDYAPYVKFKSNGSTGDVFTNYKTYDKCGVQFTDVSDFRTIPADECSYSDILIDLPPDVAACVDLMSSPGYFDAPTGFKFGRFSVERFVPARFGRMASVDDLDKYVDYFQLIPLGVLAGARKKSGHIFNSYRFYLIDVLSHMCLAVPVGYVHEFSSLHHIEGNKLSAQDFQALFVTTNNVQVYVTAASEVNSYLFSCFMAVLS